MRHCRDLYKKKSYQIDRKALASYKRLGQLVKIKREKKSL